MAARKLSFRLNSPAYAYSRSPGVRPSACEPKAAALGLRSPKEPLAVSAHPDDALCRGKVCEVPSLLAGDLGDLIERLVIHLQHGGLAFLAKHHGIGLMQPGNGIGAVFCEKDGLPHLKTGNFSVSLSELFAKEIETLRANPSV